MWTRFLPQDPSLGTCLEPLRASLHGQASAAQADAAELMRQAAALEAQSAAEQQAGALQEDLRRRHEAAVASLEVTFPRPGSHQTTLSLLLAICTPKSLQAWKLEG